MDISFINPNWHVILMHLPLGVLTTGILLESAGIVWPRYNIRNAARWMILIGTLGAVVTVMAGVYAFRNVVADVPTLPQFKWYALVAQSTWAPAQWEFMEDHITSNIIATGCFVMVMLVWLASTDLWQRKLYWPLLLILLVGAGFTSAGAWHGGEAVYRYGTAVNPAVMNPHSNSHIMQDGTINQRHGIDYYVPPLQLHVVFAGVVIAMTILSIGLMVRRWLSNDEKQPAELASVGQYAAAAWLVVVLSVVVTACAGVWSVLGSVRLGAIGADYGTLTNQEHARLLVHLLAALLFSGIVISIAVLAGRNTRASKIMTGILAGCALAAAIVIVWMGVLMLYDSDEGPLTGFNKAAVVHDAGARSNLEAPAPVMSVSEQIAGYRK